MDYHEYEINSPIWLYPGMAAWHFITIPEDVSLEIERQFRHVRRGWGSLPVQVTIRTTTWETSIFPDKKLRAYLLPVKAEVRKKEKLVADDRVQFTVRIRK